MIKTKQQQQRKIPETDEIIIKWWWWWTWMKWNEEMKKNVETQEAAQKIKSSFSLYSWYFDDENDHITVGNEKIFPFILNVCNKQKITSDIK